MRDMCVKSGKFVEGMSEIPLINAKQSSTETRGNCAGAGKCAADKAIDGDATSISVTWGSDFDWWSAQLSSRATIKEVIFTTIGYAFGKGWFNRLRVDTAESSNGPWKICKA